MKKARNFVAYDTHFSGRTFKRYREVLTGKRDRVTKIAITILYGIGIIKYIIFPILTVNDTRGRYSSFDTHTHRSKILVIRNSVLLTHNSQAKVRLLIARCLGYKMPTCHLRQTYAINSLLAVELHCNRPFLCCGETAFSILGKGYGLIVSYHDRRNIVLTFVTSLARTTRRTGE